MPGKKKYSPAKTHRMVKRGTKQVVRGEKKAAKGRKKIRKAGY
jgi:hypothetical protein